MDKREISNITSYFQVIKSTAKVSADSEQILGEKIVVNKSPVKVRVPDKTFHPKSSYVFPKRVFGKQNQFFNSKWFKVYPWLDYDEVSDSVTCFVCMHHYSKLKGNVEKSFYISRLSRLETCSFFV